MGKAFKRRSISKAKEKFDKHKSEGQILPRPGQKVQLTFVSTERMDRYENEAVHFFKELLKWITMKCL